MILIAESGSTKCDWLLYDTKGKLIDQYRSMGFNPYFHSPEFIRSSLASHKELNAICNDIDKVFFFGAGVSSPALVDIIHDALSAFFKKADFEIDHDLTAAAYATYSGEAGISCIIGTGSNSCFFDGHEIREEVPSLAYILGDEASGSFYGKKLLTAYFYKQLPQELHIAFESDYPDMNKDKLTQELYQSNHPNVFLASFMPFIIKHRNHLLIRQWIQEGFDLFIKYQVLCYPEAKEVPIHFVGSIADLLQNQLKAALEKEQCQLGQIIAKPADALANYIFNHFIHS